jgi:hypothetical protein
MKGALVEMLMLIIITALLILLIAAVLQPFVHQPVENAVVVVGGVM